MVQMPEYCLAKFGQFDLYEKHVHEADVLELIKEWCERSNRPFDLTTVEWKDATYAKPKTYNHIDVSTKPAIRTVLDYFISTIEEFQRHVVSTMEKRNSTSPDTKWESVPDLAIAVQRLAIESDKLHLLLTKCPSLWRILNSYDIHNAWKGWVSPL